MARANPVSGDSLDASGAADFDLAGAVQVQWIAHRGGVVDEVRIENNLPAIAEEFFDEGNLSLWNWHEDGSSFHFEVPRGSLHFSVMQP